MKMFKQKMNILFENIQQKKDKIYVYNFKTKLAKFIFRPKTTILSVTFFIFKTHYKFFIHSSYFLRYKITN